MNFNCSILSNEPWDSLHMASACLYVAPELRKLSTKKNKQLVWYVSIKIMCWWVFPQPSNLSHGHVKIDLAFSKRNSWYTYLKQRSFLNDPTGEYFDGHFCGCESKGGCRFGCGLCKPG